MKIGLVLKAVTVATLSVLSTDARAQDGKFDGVWRQSGFETGLRVKISGETLEVLSAPGSELCEPMQGRFSFSSDRQKIGVYEAICADLFTLGMVMIRDQGGEIQIAFCNSLSTVKQTEKCVLAPPMAAERINEADVRALVPNAGQDVDCSAKTRAPSFNTPNPKSCY